MSVFVRKITGEVASLVKKIDVVLGECEEQKLAGFVVLLSTNSNIASGELKSLARKHKIKRLPLTIYDGASGPPNYSIAKNADVTVVMWSGEKKLVRTNYSFVEKKLDESAIAKIVVSISKLCATDRPSASNSRIIVNANQKRAVTVLKKMGAAIRVSAEGKVVGVGIFNTRVSGQQLAHLELLTEIETLDLQDANITAVGLKHLKRLSKLRSLNLFRNKRLTDAGVDVLCGLTQLERLNISSTRITNTGLERLLTHLTKLKTLNIRNSKDITDAGLVHLKRGPQLEVFRAGNTLITGAGLAHICKLTKLAELEIRRTKIRNADLKHLNGLVKLQKLNVSDNNITSDGVKHLRDLTGLRSLELSQTRIDDAALRYLKGLIQLERLDLSRTRITGAGLHELRALRKLRFLNLFETHVTNEDISSLKKTVPNCEILR